MVKAKTLVVANWKMNPETYKEAEKIYAGSVVALKKASKVKVVLCLPYTWLTDFSHKEKKVVSFGAQDASIEVKGPHTGEVSPTMLTSSGVEYVILGHSERRALGETDELVSQKVSASLKTGLRVILCVGEKTRDLHGDYLLFLRHQIINSLNKIPKRYLKKLIVAYEPVWAIGKSDDEAMNVRDLHETSIFIKKALAEIYGPVEGMKIPILYGGSVSHKNAKDLLTLGEVQGLLVGRESLNPKKFESLLLSING
jgi:triosephosphate isomerase